MGAGCDGITVWLPGQIDCKQELSPAVTRLEKVRAKGRRLFDQAFPANFKCGALPFPQHPQQQLDNATLECLGDQRRESRRTITHGQPEMISNLAVYVWYLVPNAMPVSNLPNKIGNIPRSCSYPMLNSRNQSVKSPEYRAGPKTKQKRIPTRHHLPTPCYSMHPALPSSQRSRHLTRRCAADPPKTPPAPPLLPQPRL